MHLYQYVQHYRLGVCIYSGIVARVGIVCVGRGFLIICRGGAILCVGIEGLSFSYTYTSLSTPANYSAVDLSSNM